jgi:hypothetical protein
MELIQSNAKLDNYSCELTQPLEEALELKGYDLELSCDLIMVVV